MKSALAILAVLILALLSSHFPHQSFNALAQEKDPQEVLEAPLPVHTTSRFEKKLITEVTPIPRQTITQNDPNKELDDDSVLDEGKDGQKTTVYEISYYEGAEYSRDIVSEEVIPAKDKIVSHGT